MDSEKSQLVEKRNSSDLDFGETSQADDDEHLRGLLSKRHREKRRRDAKMIIMILVMFFMAATNLVLFLLLKVEQSKKGTEIPAAGFPYAAPDGM
jgi:hypothetical protein